MLWFEPHKSSLILDFGIYVLPVGVRLAPPDALVGVLPAIVALPGVVLLPSANCHCDRFAAELGVVVLPLGSSSSDVSDAPLSLTFAGGRTAIFRPDSPCFAGVDAPLALVVRAMLAYVDDDAATEVSASDSSGDSCAAPGVGFGSGLGIAVPLRLGVKFTHQ